MRSQVPLIMAHPARAGLEYRPTRHPPTRKYSGRDLCALHARNLLARLSWQALFLGRFLHSGVSHPGILLLYGPVGACTSVLESLFMGMVAAPPMPKRVLVSDEPFADRTGLAHFPACRSSPGSHSRDDDPPSHAIGSAGGICTDEKGILPQRHCGIRGRTMLGLRRADGGRAKSFHVRPATLLAAVGNISAHASWHSWRYSLWLGLLFGISFLAGQPNIFLYRDLSWSIYNCRITGQYRSKHRFREVFQPLLFTALSMAVAAGVSAIQLLPSSELIALSAREHLTYTEASAGGLGPWQFINFAVPKFFGESPGFSVPHGPSVNNPYWYWEAAFYWGVLAELLALFGLVSRWNERRSGSVKTRYLFFFACFSTLCTVFAMGKYSYFQWIFWRFLPVFSHIRAPNRMMWFVWFLGTILTGIGLDTLASKQELSRKFSRLLLGSSACFIALNILAISGVLDILLRYVRPGARAAPRAVTVVLPSLIASLSAASFFFAVVRDRVRPKQQLL